MSPQEFVELFHKDKEYYLNTLLDDDPKNTVSRKIQDLGLNDVKMADLTEIVNDILIEIYYRILLGLDGCAPIGRYQYDYKIYGEDGTLITDGGELESHAWEYFQRDR